MIWSAIAYIAVAFATSWLLGAADTYYSPEVAVLAGMFWPIALPIWGVIQFLTFAYDRGFGD